MVIDWAEESKNDTEAGEKQLDIISELAGEMLALESEIAEKEAEANALKTKYMAISQGSLPEAMLALGLTELKHVSGRKLICEKFYQAKIPESMRDTAFKYLEDTGNDSIIKTDVEVKFGKGEKEKAEKIFELLCAQGVLPSMKTGVHHSTLRAFVREQIESGAQLPLDAFGVYVGNRIKVK
jgi:hypothetical protein